MQIMEFSPYLDVLCIYVNGWTSCGSPAEHLAAKAWVVHARKIDNRIELAFDGVKKHGTWNPRASEEAGEESCDAQRQRRKGRRIATDRLHRIGDLSARRRIDDQVGLNRVER